MAHGTPQPRAEREISEALHRFYYEHHDSAKLHAELTELVVQSRVRSFNELKRRVTGAVEARVETLKKEVVIVRNNSFGNNDRVDELESFRTFVKGMAVKVYED